VVTTASSGRRDPRLKLIPGFRTSPILTSPHRLKGRYREARDWRDGARRPRVFLAIRHSGGAGAPPGSTTRPCQELADDRLAYPKRDPSVDLPSGLGKRGTDGESAARRC